MCKLTTVWKVLRLPARRRKLHSGLVPLALLLLLPRSVISQGPSAAVNGFVSPADDQPVQNWNQHFRCGEQYYEQRKLAQAEHCFELAFAAANQASGDEFQRGMTLNSLGTVLLEKGRISAAMDATLAAAEAFRKCNAERCRPGLAAATHGLAILYTNQGRLFDAERLLREALELYTRAHAPEVEVAKVLESFGWIELNRGRARAAESYFRRALVLIPEVDGVDPRRGRLYGSLSHALLQQGRKSEALEAAQQGVDAVSVGRGSGPLDVVSLTRTLAAAGLAMGDFALAERSLTQAQAALSTVPEMKTREEGMVLTELAYLRFREKRFPEAVQFLGDGIAILKHHLSADHPQMLRLKTSYAGLLRKVSRRQEARLIEEEVRVAAGRAELACPSFSGTSEHCSRWNESW